MQLKLLQRNERIVFRDRENFLSRLAVLLREGYMLPTALTLLLPMHTPKLAEALEGVTSILKGGGNAAEILKFLGFKENVLFPVEIAEHHGRLAESIDSISKSFSRTEQVQKKLRNILLYPVSLLFFTSGLFLFFRTSYVPNLEKLMASLNADGEGSGVPAYLLNLPDLFIGCFAIAGIGAAAFAALLKKKEPAQKIAWLTRLPVLRTIMVFYWSHLLARELGTLLHSGISLQESLQLLQQQTHHSIIQHMAEVCHGEVVTGIPLSDALRRHSFFAPDMAAFVQHGEMAGFLGKELILYSEVMLERIEARTQRLLKIIQPAFFIMIAACIVGAYLAILLPMYNLVHTI